VATTNKHFNDARVLRGLEDLQNAGQVIREELIELSVNYNPTAANAAHTTTIRVVKDHLIEAVEADSILRNS